MFKWLLVLLSVLFLRLQSHAQQRPRLVVGIVVDQMRYDYLERFATKFGNGGFKRLMGEGYNFKQCNINYFPSYTAPGHAAIYTGTTPSVNGIVANEWFDNMSGDTMYCVSDSTVETVGSDNKAGKMSPRNLFSSTMTDELRLNTNFKGKVFGVCIKDRGSILPAGHAANGAYWFDYKTGNWITSTYYTNTLPAWVQRFNESKVPERLINQTWNTLLPIEKYTESSEDNTIYEAPLTDKEALPVFPHKLGEIRKEGYGMLLSTPWGNTMTKEFALLTIENEKLGADSITDFLALSFSSTDYVGHHFGINSIELEDTYLRLDLEISEVLSYLDKKVGKGNYLVFLTADHGCAHNPQFLIDNKIPAGYFDSKMALDSLKKNMSVHMKNVNLVRFYDNQQIYLNDVEIDGKFMNRPALSLYIAKFISRFDGVDECITYDQLQNTAWTEGTNALLQRGFHPQRCGDVYIKLKPGWMEMSRKTGTTHGSPFSYDTHIPFLMMGWGVKPGSSSQPVSIIDIAPTICNLLSIQVPNGCTGKVVYQR